jgi:hypothetical protein
MFDQVLSVLNIVLREFWKSLKILLVFQGNKGNNRISMVSIVYWTNILYPVLF